MHGTIIIEKYQKTEREKVANALKVLTVENFLDWATAGIYCYWDYYSKQILYIGLAVDLEERFKQHNGLKSCPKSSCKIEEIEEYFNQNEYIGFTVILQSALSQPTNHRQEKLHKKSFNRSQLKDILGTQGHDEIKRLEGILLEAFLHKHGEYPTWNKMGGSVVGKKAFKPKNIKLLELLMTNEPNQFVSRLALTKLVENATYLRFEAYLHSIRISPMPIEDTIQMHKNLLGLDTFDQIGKTDYFKLRLDV